MQYYEKYIVTNRCKKKCICGNVNIPYGSDCVTIDFGDSKAITYNGKIICLVTSEDAYNYFTQNDDGNGKERGRLINNIRKTLAKLNQTPEKKNKIWDKIWNDSVCLKYKRPDNADHWIWNYDFFNANLYDLNYIAKLVGAK